MTNLVARLRVWNGNSFGPFKSPVPDLLEAADEIERLTRERDEWTEQAQRWRAKYAELRYPGMKGVILPMDGTAVEPSERT